MTKGTSTTRRTSRRASPPPAGLSSRAAKAIVRSGWNAVSEIYRPDSARATYFGLTAATTARWLAPLLRRIPAGAHVVDLGCGCGLPVARQLAARFRVTGVDLSDRQIERARRLVPGARFRRNDMARVRFPAGSLGAVVAFYSLIHLPVREQRPLLARIYRWLAPGGLLLLVAGEGAGTMTEEGWLGSDATMYWSHAAGDTYARWLRDLGFFVERRSTVAEPGAVHSFFRARRPVGTTK